MTTPVARGAWTLGEVLAGSPREHTFEDVRVDGADFRAHRYYFNAVFSRSWLPRAVFDRTVLAEAWFTEVDLTEASFAGADFSQAHLSECNLRDARLPECCLINAVFAAVDLSGADLTRCDLSGAQLVAVTLDDARLDAATIGGTAFSDMDVTPFCDADGLVHGRPSYVDFRSVLRSYRHPGLKRFLVDCGVPPLVAEYTIAAAEAEGDALATLMRSTFISYGGPDEAFARRLNDELRAHGVTTFFFPERARPGKRSGDEMHSRIQEHDRVILVCSRDSLDRPGVRNEIQETFDREARDGGATYLIPIMLDDYVLTGWDDPLAERVRGRVIGDFRGALADDAVFDRAMRRLLAELRTEPSPDAAG